MEVALEIVEFNNKVKQGTLKDEKDFKYQSTLT